MAIKRFSGDRFSGLSTDTKPINILSGAFFTETDTGKSFVYDGSSWQTADADIVVSSDTSLTGDGSSGSPLSVDESNVDHDSLANFVSNEHINHTSVSMIAGTGLSGGGNIAANRTFNLAIDTLASLGAAPVNTDLLAIYDSSAGNHKEISIGELESGISITESQISDLGNYVESPNIQLAVFNSAGTPTEEFSVALMTENIQFDAGGDASIAFDAVNNRITFSATNTVYTHPTGFTDAPGTALTGDTVISQIDVTSEGHVNGVFTRELNYDNYTSWGLQVNTGAITEITSGADVDLIGSGATSISRTGNAVTISSTDTDTTYTAGTGLTLSAGTFSAHLAANANATTVDLDDATSNALAVTIPNATTTTAGVISGADQQKVDYLTVTAATDLDAIRARVNELDASVVLSGTWDASLGSFPSATNKGESFIVSTGGTVDGVEFVANDRIVALVDSPSTTVYASNWHKLDYTDAVLSVDGQTGAVTLDYIDSVTAGTGLTGGGSTGALTVNFDIFSLNDNAAALVGADEIAIYDASLGTNKRANFSEIPLSILNDDLNVVTGAAGSNHQIQFNDAGAFGADVNFLWDDNNQNFSVTGGRTLSEGGVLVAPATHGEVYDYVTTEVVGGDTITRYMSRLGNGDDVIVASYIQVT